MSKLRIVSDNNQKSIGSLIKKITIKDQLSKEYNKLKKLKKEDFDKKQVNANELKLAIKDIREMSDFAQDIPERVQKILFWTHLGIENPMASKLMKDKKIGFSFNPSEKEKKKWIKEGFLKLSSLLSILEKTYGNSNNFDLVLFRENSDDSYFIKQDSESTTVYVNVDIYLEYGTKINEVMNNLKIRKYSERMWRDFSKKVPIAFFKKKSPSELPDELKNSYYGILEEIINDVEDMPDSEDKTNLSMVIIQSNLARKTLDNFKKLDSNDPAKQLQTFTPSINKLKTKEVEILVRKIVNSNISADFIDAISKLPLDQRNRIAKKLPEMATMYRRYEKLEDSLTKFKKLIDKHNKSKTKDEAEIHKFLTKHYWLIGIEYFDKELLSDFDSEGNRINETKLVGSKKHPDFIVKRLDGFDKCVVIELEESNDPIFKQNGEFSPKVYDGIFQAADYNIEQKFRDLHSKGIAVIGSTKGMEMDDDKKKRFKLLLQEFPNIEILTYDQIIAKAQSTLEFWKKYDIKKSLIEE